MWSPGCCFGSVCLVPFPWCTVLWALCLADHDSGDRVRVVLDARAARGLYERESLRDPNVEARVGASALRRHARQIVRVTSYGLDVRVE